MPAPHSTTTSMSAAEIREAVERHTSTIDETTFYAIYRAARIVERTLQQSNNPMIDTESAATMALLTAAVASARGRLDASLQDVLSAVTNTWDVAGVIARDLPEAL